MRLNKIKDGEEYTQQKGVGYAITGYEDDPTEEQLELAKKELATPSLPQVGKMYYVAGFRDWWRTNVVEKIMEDTEEYILFKTASGTVYRWWK